MQKDFDKNLLTPIYDTNFTESGHRGNLPQHNNAESIPFPGGSVVKNYWHKDRNIYNAICPIKCFHWEYNLVCMV